MEKMVFISIFRVVKRRSGVKVWRCVRCDIDPDRASSGKNIASSGMPGGANKLSIGTEFETKFSIPEEEINGKTT